MSSRLVAEVPRNKSESDVAFAHRLRVVTRVAVAGAGMLGLSFSSEPGSRRSNVAKNLVDSYFGGRSRSVSRALAHGLPMACPWNNSSSGPICCGCAG